MSGRTRKGFTLVELLIVMIIISILAGAMLVAQRSSTASAQASVIMSDLRLMKAGAHLLTTENPDQVQAYVPGMNYAEELGKFMDNGRIMNNPVRYAFFVTGNDIWVGVAVQGYETEQVKSALAARKRSASMFVYGSNGILTVPPDDTDANIYTESHAAIWTKVR